MFPKTTDDDYETLQNELKSNNKPGVWVGQMLRKLENSNPAVAEFIYELQKRFEDRPWYPHGVHCALATYRLLEIAAKMHPLPRVKYEVGAPMQVEALRNLQASLATWTKRISEENPRVVSVILDYTLEHTYRGGDEKEAGYVIWAGQAVYQYLARQHEADELAQLPLG